MGLHVVQSKPNSGAGTCQPITTEERIDKTRAVQSRCRHAPLGDLIGLLQHRLYLVGQSKGQYY